VCLIVIPITNEIKGGILESADGRLGSLSVKHCLKFLQQFSQVIKTKLAACGLYDM